MSDTKAKKKPTKAKNKKPPAKKKLNLQHQQFIDNYTDIDNAKTFNNGTQSYLASYPNSQYDTAKNNGSKLLAKDYIQDSIEALIEQMKLGSKVRLETIQEVMTGKALQETVTTSTDTEGKEYTSITVKSPTASDRLKAVDLIAKLDGTYDKNKAKADVVSIELKELIRSQRKDLTGDKGRGK